MPYYIVSYIYAEEGQHEVFMFQFRPNHSEERMAKIVEQWIADKQENEGWKGEFVMHGMQTAQWIDGKFC